MNRLRAAHHAQHVAIGLRRLDIVIEQARADHVIRRLDRGEAHVEPIEDRNVALRAEMKNRLAGASAITPQVTSPDETMPS